MTVTVKPLSPALGAEIAGVDLREELSAATIAGIIAAWHRHLVLLFRDQSLSEDDQIRFAQHFGTLQKRTRPAEAINEAGHTQYPQLTMLVSNIRENGKLIGSLPDGEMHFHSDQCYLEKPATGTFLYAMEVPSAATRCFSICTRPTRRCRLN
jgi:taurine dioxygenase